MPLLDPPLVPPPKIKLSKLRDIGWSIWDPIGMLAPDQNWNDEDYLQFADEYDNYLIFAASQLRRNTPKEQVVHYLMDIEIEMTLAEPVHVLSVETDDGETLSIYAGNADTPIH